MNELLIENIKKELNNKNSNGFIFIDGKSDEKFKNTCFEMISKYRKNSI